jgi:hypothetical protein
MIPETPSFTRTRFTVLSLVLAFAIHPPTGIASDFQNADAAESFQRRQAGDPPRRITQSEDIETGDHVWDNVDVPYLVAGFMNIEEGASLTIRPGVTVEFAPGAQLEVFGRLTAHGTKDRTITFTGQTKTPGSWLSIQICGEEDEINDECSFRYVTIEYGGTDLVGDARFGGALHLNYATATIDNCVIRESGSSGVFATLLSSCEIRSTSFLNNAGHAVFLAVTSTFGKQAPDPLMRDLTASGNGADGVGLAESFPMGDYVLEYTGLPYYIYGSFRLVEGASLLIEPGVTAKFEQNAEIGVTGPLTAIGTPEKPIVLTGIAEEPGAWDGVNIEGILHWDWPSPTLMEWERNEGSRLSYVTIDYGGNMQGALTLEYAKAYLSNCIIRNSERAGIYVDNADGSVIEWSRIEDNGTFGVERWEGGAIQAAHNWWGDASGPYHKKDNVAGAGNEIEVGAAEFLPFLISPNQQPGAIPADQVLSLTATPGRWFAPANGVSLVPVSIVVRDANGDPVPGRKTRLNATIGDVVDGDITDIEGNAEAFVGSTVVGNAMLTPALDLAGTYPARATTAEVTFTTPTTTLDLFPDAEAPYVNRRIEMSPLPITVGVPVTITAEVTNPSTYSLNLEISFVKHNYGVGLPLDVIETKTAVIPPQSATPVSAVWTPLSPGHQCIGLMGSFSESQGLRGRFVEFPLADSTFELPWLHNTYPVPSPFLDEGAKNQLEQVETAVGALNDLSNAVQMIFDGAGYIGGFLTGFMLDNLLSSLLDAWKDAIQAIQLDPPRQDFRQYAAVETYEFDPAVAGNGISAERAAAANAMIEAHLDLLAKLRAAQITLDRYAGAALANEQTWTSQQAAALIHFYKRSGEALLLSADRIDAFIQALRNEGVEDVRTTRENYVAYQERLRTQGFNATELQAAAIINRTGEELERYRQRIISNDPDKATQRSLLTMMEDLAREFRRLGPMLRGMDNFGVYGSTASSVPGRGGRRLPAADESTNLVQIYSSDHVIHVGNPLDHATSVSLRVRRIDLPADWMVRVAPSRLSLAAGQVTTATVAVSAGSSSVQGTKPRVAVEAYAEGRLLGGVAIDTVIPSFVAFAAPPDAPSSPQPAHGARDVGTTTTLSWQGSQSADIYDLYLWKTSDGKPAAPTATSLTVALYAPPAALDEGADYSWQVIAKNATGSTTGPTWIFSTENPSAIRDLIRSFYVTILGREPEGGAVDSWHHGYFDYAVNFNIDVRFIPREMARLFFLSTEYANRNRANADFITDCYQVFLNRAPNQIELDNWLAGVWNRAQVMTVFSESEEFANRIEAMYPQHGGDPARNFVTTMYTGLLDRLVDRAGLEYASGLFDAANAQGGIEAVRAQAKQMGREVIVSAEFLAKGPTNQDRVVRLYRAFLGRFPNDSEIAYWSGLLDAGTNTPNGLIDLFGDAPEFTSRLNEFF